MRIIAPLQRIAKRLLVQRSQVDEVQRYVKLATSKICQMTHSSSSQSAVSVAHAPPKQKVVEARKIGNLPQPYKEKFDTGFVPLVIKLVAQSEDPWNHPDAGTPLQKIHNSVYKNVDAIVDRQHVLIEPVSVLRF